MSYTKNVYDFKSHPKTSYPDELINYLVKRYKIKPGSKLLEIGCGRGDFINAFSDAGMKAYAVDIEDKHKCVYEGVVFHRVNIEADALPLEDSSVDVIFTKSVIEHIFNPENLMRECFRVLKNNGLLIVMSPDWQTTMYLFYDDYTHIHPYTVESLRLLLSVYNFKNVHSEKFCQLPILWRKPYLKVFSVILQMLGPVKKYHKRKFVRWSRELMVLATGYKKVKK